MTEKETTKGLTVGREIMIEEGTGIEIETGIVREIEKERENGKDITRIAIEKGKEEKELTSEWLHLSENELTREVPEMKLGIETENERGRETEIGKGSERLELGTRERAQVTDLRGIKLILHSRFHLRVFDL